MGVAGDGNQGLDKEWTGQAQMAKSKTMSAKVAWGKSTGYADTLREQGVDTARAQQLENWNNQREVQEQRYQHRWMTDSFDQTSSTGGPDQDWRSLSSYSGELTQESDIDQTLGQVIPGPVTGVIELHARSNQASVHEFSLKVCVFNVYCFFVIIRFLRQFFLFNNLLY
jgi:ribosomal protein L22